MQKYVERSRAGAQRAAADPEIRELLGKPDTGKRMTRKQFAARFSGA
jgi:hypothetical protein